MPKKNRNHDTNLNESLKDPNEAVAYINAHLEDDGDDGAESFLLALGDVVKAHGFKQISEKSGLRQEILYKTLSKDGNPEFKILMSFLKMMGFKLSVSSEDIKASSQNRFQKRRTI